MLKTGLICELNAEKAQARVHFKDVDVVSNWLPMSMVRAGEFKMYCPFSINEQVWCIMDDNCEYGVIAGAMYNDEMPIPEGGGKDVLIFRFSNNSAITFDGNSKTLTLEIDGDITVNAKGNVSINADEDAQITAKNVSVEATGTASVKGASVMVEATGSATVKGATVAIDAPATTMSGTLAVTGGVTAASIAAGSFSGAGGGAMVSSSDIETTGDVKAGSVSLKLHTHTAPSGGGATTPPIP